MKLAPLLNEIQDSLIVYHGTNTKFSSFNDSEPIFFSDDIKVAKSYGNIIIKAKLDLDNPLKVDFDGGSTITFMGKHYVPSQFAKLIKGISDDIKKYGIDDEMREELGYYDWYNGFVDDDLDGIIMHDIKDSYGDIFAGNIVANNYVVFNKNQIKIIS
jgi:hypothetical protein